MYPDINALVREINEVAEFYTDENNYKIQEDPKRPKHAWTPIDADKGQRARQLKHNIVTYWSARLPVASFIAQVLSFVGFHPIVLRPEIVCLCGSTRFSEAFQQANFNLTLQGKIVLTIGCDMKSDNELFAAMTPEQLAHTKADLDRLHREKIKLADSVFVLNVNGYIGESTMSELAYARELGKHVTFLEPPPVTRLRDTISEKDAYS